MIAGGGCVAFCDGACLEIAAQQGARAFGPEGRDVHVLERCKRGVQRHRLPWLDAGLDIGVHGLGGWLLARCAFGGRDRECLHVDLRGLGGERAGGLHLCAHRDGGIVLGHRVGHLQIALEVGLQLHRACALQLDVGLVRAVGIAHFVHRELVVVAVVGVVAGQPIDGGLGRAFPDDAVDLKRYLDLDRQRELFERLGRLLGCVRIGRALDAQFADVQHAELQGALQQRLQAPADLGVLHLHAHGRALPFERTDLAAAAHRAGDFAGFEALAFGQKTCDALQCVGERIVAASPPPGGAECGNDHQHKSEQQPADATQPAARFFARLLGSRGRGVGFRRCLRRIVDCRFHHDQNVKPRRRCRRSCCSCRP